jgi:hypothetical protein
MTPAWRDQVLNGKPRPALRGRRDHAGAGADGRIERSLSGTSTLYRADGPFSLPPERGEGSGFVLACAAAAAFCAGLFGLAASPWFGVEAPRWFILAYGVSCALLALLALPLSSPRRKPGPRRADAAFRIDRGEAYRHSRFPRGLFWPIREAVQISSGRDPGGSAEKGPQESPSEGVAQFRGRSRPWRDWRAGDGGGTLPAPGGGAPIAKGAIMSSDVINVIDKTGDHNGHLLLQWLFHWKPVLARNVADMVDGVITRAGKLGTIRILRIFGHGRPGRQGMGAGQSYGTSDTVIAAGASRTNPALARLTPYFARGAVVQLHGCNVGVGWEGQYLLQKLAGLWNVRVQAAIDTQFPNLFVDEFEGSYWEADGSGGKEPTMRFYHAA